MKVALVHDHLNQLGGAERVLEALQSLYPKAPTFTLLHDKKAVPEFDHREIRTSFLQRLPFSTRFARYLLPLMPTATESYDLSNFDVVLSSSSAFSKGVITHPDTLHICYCHTPTRYLWSDAKSYVDELRAPGFIKKLLPPLLTWLRAWDFQSAQRVDLFVANSETVKRRIKKYYGRESVVIHPPVDIDHFSISDKPKEYFLIGGRLVPYKRYDVVIEAFNKTGLPLVVFGTGPQEKELRKNARENIKFVGKVSNEERARLFAEAIAFIHPQEEDFGITPVEAMAAGTPVIAYRKGGAIETVIDGVTGIMFDEQSWEEIADTVLHFDRKKFNPKKIRAQAEQFSLQEFHKKMSEYVVREYENRD